MDGEISVELGSLWEGFVGAKGCGLLKVGVVESKQAEEAGQARGKALRVNCTNAMLQTDNYIECLLYASTTLVYEYQAEIILTHLVRPRTQCPSIPAHTSSPIHRNLPTCLVNPTTRFNDRFPLPPPPLLLSNK